MHSVSFRIWTRVAVSISYDDNHYTTGTSFMILFYVFNIIIIIIYDQHLNIFYLIARLEFELANIPIQNVNYYDTRTCSRRK